MPLREAQDETSSPGRAGRIDPRQSEVVPRRAADVYVFALLEHEEPGRIDPLELTHWKFLVVATRVLDARAAGRKTLSLAAPRGLGAIEVRHAGIAAAIEQALAAA